MSGARCQTKRLTEDGLSLPAAPLYAYAGSAAIERRWNDALGALAAGNAAFLTWAALTIALMLGFNYSYGWNGNGSAGSPRRSAITSPCTAATATPARAAGKTSVA